MMIRRILFGIGTLVFLIAGLYTGDHIFYIGFALLVSVLFYAIITNLWVLLDFNYLQTITPNQTRKGEDVTLVMQIHNEKPFIFPFIRIYYLLPNSVLTGKLQKGVLSILPFRYGEIRENFSCTFRGSYALGIIQIEVMDLFGLFKFHMDLSKRHYHKPLILTVSPRIIHLHHLPLPHIQQEGLMHNQLLKSHETATPSEIREYRYGDPLKRIHWKASSKIQEILVMDHEITTQPHALLYLEGISPKEPQSLERHEIEDQLIETTTAITHYILHQWLPLKLIVYGEKRRELNGRNPHAFQAFYELLTEIEMESPFSMEAVMQFESVSFHPNSSLILVIHQLSYSLFNHVCVLKQTGIHPMIFLIQHRSNENRQTRKMIDELNEKGIPSLLIYSDQRLDQALEVFL